MHQCWIGVGANVGDHVQTFNLFWQWMRDHPRITPIDRSGIFSTMPVGAVAGAVFSNAVVSLNTTLEPLQLLAELQTAEALLGRTRELRWGPRAIDLDLLFVDQIVLETEQLVVPHIAAWYRQFVLRPLAEVDATLVHPLLGISVSAIIEQLAQRPFVISLNERSAHRVAEFERSIQSKFPHILFDTNGQRRDRSTVSLRLDPSEPHGPRWQSSLVADLTQSPGDVIQRVTDFCTSVFDVPVRICDWS